MKWYKKLHRDVKKFWDEKLRPTVEPVLMAILQGKIAKELDRHK